jgi:hypothetical protein
VKSISLAVIVGAMSAGLGCTTTTVAHHALTSPHGTSTHAEFGLGKTSVAERSFGSSSDTTDVRVEHAADVGPGGAVDRFWRVALESGTDANAIGSQHLELCTGAPGAPHACSRARVVAADGKEQADFAGSFPSLLEAGNRGASLRLVNTSSTGVATVGSSVVTFNYQTESRSGDDIKKPVGHETTPAFGVWALSEAAGVIPTLAGTAGLLRTGGLFFCHAPTSSGPRCVHAPNVENVDKILAVHLLHRGKALRHVVWAESMTGPLDARVGTIIRCEADDETASPTCTPAEVH